MKSVYKNVNENISNEKISRVKIFSKGKNFSKVKIFQQKNSIKNFRWKKIDKKFSKVNIFQ